MTTSADIAYEEELIRLSVADPESFRPLYEKYFKNIYLFVFHRVGDRDLSGDITQQVFLKALVGLSKFEHRGVPFSAWLYKIAINQCNEHFRKSNKVRTVTLDETGVSQLHDDLTSDHTLDHLQERLPKILERLESGELQLVELRYFESRSFAEIGIILDITENNAKVKTYRVLQKMKKLFLL